MIQALLTRLFSHEEINGGERCPTYMHRWTLARIGDCAIYLHWFVGDDWTRDLHDHPKRFISIGLAGGYVEQTEAWNGQHWRKYSQRFRAPWFRSFPATHRHRLRLGHADKDCWTLVIVGPASREWGFWPEGRFLPHRDYLASSLADQARDC